MARAPRRSCSDDAARIYATGAIKVDPSSLDGCNVVHRCMREVCHARPQRRRPGHIRGCPAVGRVRAVPGAPTAAASHRLRRIGGALPHADTVPADRHAGTLHQADGDADAVPGTRRTGALHQANRYAHAVPGGKRLREDAASADAVPGGDRGLLRDADAVSARRGLPTRRPAGALRGRSYSRTSSPLLPPLLRTSRTPSMRMPRSAALHMS